MKMMKYLMALWRSMRVLIDTNILIDFLLKRDPYYKNAKEVLMVCTHENVKGFIAMHTVSNLWYILRNETHENRRKCLRIICTALIVCFTNHNEVYNAIKNTNMKDLEDCMQDSCAYVNKLDYIITRNIKDFKNSRVKVIMPEDFIRKYYSK